MSGVNGFLDELNEKVREELETPSGAGRPSPPASATSPGTPPSRRLQQPYSRITRHEVGSSGTTSDGTGSFSVNREVRYPLMPFLGTIVTAPERGIENTLVRQGPWGGNIDCRDVKKGNRVMHNTSHDGGLLFFGDAHAAQGDSSTRD